MLAGKSIVVIGGTTGIGKSARDAFVAQGASVVYSGLSDEDTNGRNRIYCRGDATKEGSAEEVIELCIRQFGSFDGLYHVAGGSGRAWGDGPLHELTREAWDETLHLNLTSVMFSNRAAVRQFLKDDRGGAIVNLSTLLANRPSPRYFGTHAYAAAKSAIIGFSKSTAAYYAAQNIRINVISPGLIHTPMAARAAGRWDIQSFIRTKQPLDGGRMGLPSDLDMAAAYLLSDAAGFVTGQVLGVDGGWSVSEGQYPQE
jgi:NAD(P)-dependent dehydrogenase (short-subunit alcohol dehydrogenase family)